MTKREFISKQQAMTRGVNSRLAVWMVFFFAALLSGIPIGNYIDHHSEDYRWLGTMFGIGIFVFLLANVGLLLWYGSKQQKNFGHRCPACNKALIGMSAQLAIASGNCGYCGEKVFSDDA